MLTKSCSFWYNLRQFHESRRPATEIFIRSSRGICKKALVFRYLFALLGAVVSFLKGGKL